MSGVTGSRADNAAPAGPSADDRLPIVQYWHSPRPPGYIAEAIESFARNNPERPHYLFDRTTAQEVVRQHFAQRYSTAFAACGPPAMQADYWRYVALLHFGGIWSDASFTCTGNLDSLLNYAVGGELFGTFSFNQVLMNGFMAFNGPGHPFLQLVLDLSTELIERRWEGMVNEVTGSMIMSTILRLRASGSIDAFLREMSVVQKEIRSANLFPYARLICDLIGDYASITEACERLRVSSADSALAWIRAPRLKPLPHRTSADHWRRLGGNIYETTCAADAAGH